jgi:hypothetical protein
MTRICIIYPNDPTTDFLKNIPDKLSQEFGERVCILKLTSDKEDLVKAKQYIEDSSPNTFFIFLGHGTHLSLAGANTIGTGSYFVLNDNLRIFCEKRLFSLSCKSSEYFREFSTSCNLLASLGFGFIPSDIIEIEELKKQYPFYESVTEYELNKFKDILVGIIAESLIFSIRNDYSFYQIMTDLKLRINKSMTSNLKGKQKHGKINAALLFKMKEEIEVFGRVNLPLSLSPFY